MPGNDFVTWHAAWKPFEAWSAASEVAADSGVEELMMVKADHQRWLIGIKNYLESLPSDKSHPMLDAKHCRCGQWLSGNGYQRFGRMTVFEELQASHEQLHAMAKDLIAMHRQGKSIACRLRMTELEFASEAFMSCMLGLLDEIRKERQNDPHLNSAVPPAPIFSKP